MRTLADLHVHPGYSKDAQGSIDEYCRQALTLGMSAIGFTPHYDIDPVRKQIDDYVHIGGQVVSMTSDWLDVYLNDVETARRRYTPQGLTILAGLEADYAPEIEEDIRRHIAGHPFDYITGSIHCVDHVAITSPIESSKCFTQHSAHDLCESYFTVMKLAIQTGLFDVVAHLDIYRRYGLRYYGEEISRIPWGLVDHVLDAIAGDGLLLEINTSGLRDGSGRAYPDREVLRRAREKEISGVVVGSDCHQVSDLGCGIAEGYRMAAEAGLMVLSGPALAERRT